LPCCGFSWAVSECLRLGIATLDDNAVVKRQKLIVVGPIFRILV